MDTCTSLVLKYADSARYSRDPKIQIEISPARALLMFGAIHSRDPSDIQFDEIVRLWNEFKPTLVLYEGPNRGTDTSMDLTIRNFGESGLVRYLAGVDKVKALSIEKPVEEYEYLVGIYGLERVKLFYLLREAQRQREVEGKSESDISSSISELMQRAKGIFPGFDREVKSLDDLEGAFIKYFGKDIEWWMSPKAWFDPLLSSKETGGVFTNDINRSASEFRDMSLVKTITSMLQEDRRLLIVIGRNHVYMVREAVECALSSTK